MKLGLQAIADVAREIIPPPFGAFAAAGAELVSSIIEQHSAWEAIEVRRRILEARAVDDAKAEAEFR